MASPTIQQACANDLENILQLQKQAFTAVAQLLNNHNIQPLHQNLQEITAEYNKGIILKYLSPQNELIGSIRAYEDDNATCHVGKLIVQPSHQNQGIGRKLLETIETHFPNCTKFSLFTVEDTPNTAYLYQKAGYHIVAQRSIDHSSMLIMEKINTHSTS